MTDKMPPITSQCTIKMIWELFNASLLQLVINYISLRDNMHV